MTAGDQHVTAADGSIVAYDVSGAGPSVMLVHGLGFSRRLWRSQVELLVEQGFRAITVDLRGFGSSDMPREPYSIVDLADDLERVREATAADRMHLVSHSMGGMVAQHYVVAHPERVLSLFLCSTSNHNGKRARAFARVMSLLSEHGFEQAEKDVQLFAEVERTIAEVIPYTGPVMHVLRKLTEEPSVARAFAWGAIAGFSIKDEVSAIRCPALVMHGGRDQNIPFSAGQLAHQGIAGSQWVPVDHAKHNLPIEERELFNERLLAFLKEQS
jgi:pimeloyl-ACP methyl ester carboxylesterase